MAEVLDLTKRFFWEVRRYILLDGGVQLRSALAVRQLGVSVGVALYTDVNGQRLVPMYQSIYVALYHCRYVTIQSTKRN